MSREARVNAVVPGDCQHRGQKGRIFWKVWYAWLRGDKCREGLTVWVSFGKLVNFWCIQPGGMILVDF